MPLPKKFYNANGKEVSLEELCRQDPYWAASRMRHFKKQIDMLVCLTLTSPWTPVDIALPETDDPVLVYAPDCDVIGQKLIGRYFERPECWTVYDFCNSLTDERVAHWMPLPGNPSESWELTPMGKGWRVAEALEAKVRYNETRSREHGRKKF